MMTTTERSRRRKDNKDTRDKDDNGGEGTNTTRQQGWGRGVDRDGDMHTQRVQGGRNNGGQQATAIRAQCTPAVLLVHETVGSIILFYYLLPPSFVGGALFYLVSPIQCALL